MKLQALATAPQLEKITIDNPEIVERYGDVLDFYMYDKQDMDTFMQLATVNQDNQGAVFDVIKTLVRDEDGELILKDNATLPLDVMVKMIEKVVQRLGNSQSQTIAE